MVLEVDSDIDSDREDVVEAIPTETDVEVWGQVQEMAADPLTSHRKAARCRTWPQALVQMKRKKMCRRVSCALGLGWY